MKRVLDLNEPAGKIVKAIGLFLVVIPGALYALSLALAAAGRQVEALDTTIKVSLGLGVAILVGFLLLVIAEQVQDRWFDAAYRRNRGKRLPTADGYYECQYCGNRRVGAHEHTCRVCGRKLE
ncbi:MAG: hypothetical protein ACYC1C_21610 [Chloroflexota bacterium]